MAGTFIKIEGLDKTLARFDIKKFEPQVQTSFNNFGIRVELTAKSLVPVYEGRLKNSIFQDPSRLAVTVGASADYAAYLEFGTRKFAAAYVATLPQNWREFAARAKGSKGGSMEEFIQRIMAWVLRKGIGGDTTKSGNVSKSATSLDKMQQAAYWIALNILQNGIKPQPYMYPAIQKEMRTLIHDLQNITFESSGFASNTFQRRVFR